MATTERERVEKHVQAMEAERQAFHDVWRSISLYVQPGRGRLGRFRRLDAENTFQAHCLRSLG